MAVETIDQARLPFAFDVARLESAQDAAAAIRDMVVRGAPLIGATAAYGICLGLRADTSDTHLEQLALELIATRPTAVNLVWAVERLRRVLRPLPPKQRSEAAYREAALLCEEDVATNEAIGRHGLPLIEQIWRATGSSRPVFCFHRSTPISRGDSTGTMRPTSSGKP